MARAEQVKTSGTSTPKAELPTADQIRKSRRLRRAGLKRAWAIIKPEPGKEGLLRAAIKDWEVRNPTVIRTRTRPWGRGDVEFETPALPGYLFVRPAEGQRAALHFLPFCSAVLPIVIFDRLISRVEADVLAWREANRPAKAIARRAERKAQFKETADTVRMSSFEQLAAVLSRAASQPDDKSTMPVDSVKNQEQVSVNTPDSAHSATLAAYLGTDLLSESGEVKCGAMFRRRLHFS